MNRFDQPYSGKPCQQLGCDGVLRVETTMVHGDTRRRYLKCKKCGISPANNIQSVPLQYAPRQPRRSNNSFFE
jgi:hypothetical protein